MSAPLASSCISSFNLSPQVAYTLLTGNFPVGAVTDTALWATLPLVFGIMTFCYSGHGEAARAPVWR